jgi:hypothetical protein
MAVQSDTTSAPHNASQSSEISRVAVEGISAGVIGAATIAVWFFVVDLFNGRPFYTPNILGNALFRRGVEIEQLHSFPISVQTVVVYTWVHALAFCVIGGVASRLLALAERNVNLGFGILLFFVIFEFGFVGLAFLFAEPILHALTWPAVLMGNLLAAAAMGLYFWRHHLNLSIEP